MQYLNWNHLFYFCTIANAGTIRDACEKLSLTQSTLSTQLTLDKFFKANKVIPKIIGKFNDVGLLQLFAEDGQGVEILPL